jgi:ABC-type uncharacterized transport system auxiliary subunit
MKKLLFIIPLLFLSCATKEVITNYTISHAKINSQKIDKTISIHVDSTPTLQTRRIYWQKGYEKNPYLYSQWIDDFDNLIKKSVYNALFNIYKSVDFDKKADINLKLFITNATHVVSNNKSFIVLDIKAYANNKAKEFHYKVPCSANAKSAVEAFNKAIKTFENDLINWLKTI